MIHGSVTVPPRSRRAHVPHAARQERRRADGTAGGCHRQALDL